MYRQCHLYKYQAARSSFLTNISRPSTMVITYHAQINVVNPIVALDLQGAHVLRTEMLFMDSATMQQEMRLLLAQTTKLFVKMGNY